MKIYSGFIGDQLENRVRLDPELTDKPISIFYDYAINNISQLKENPYNFLFIQEPNELFGLHDWALKYGHYFDAIFTWSQPILDAYSDRAMYFAFGAGDYQIPTTYQKNKRFEVSFLCGQKQFTLGHKLRHKIFHNKNKINTSTNFIYTAPWDGGKRICWESMFHIAIENTQNKGYFTEKLIDAFLTKTIPLYWGCPNINEFFNSNGIITFNNEDELIDIINNLSPEYYESKMEYIEENYKRAIQYADFLARINKIIKEVCEINYI